MSKKSNKPTRTGTRFAPTLLTVIVAFSLICLGIVLLSREVDASAGPEPKPAQTERTQPSVDQTTATLRHARAAIRRAEQALNTENYGEVRGYLNQAYMALSPARLESGE